MNRHILFLLLPLVLSCFSCKERKQAVVQDILQEIIDTIPQAEEIKRSSITFIMGEKKELEEDTYYVLANYYYRLNPRDKTERVVDSLATLLEVRDYLAANPPSNGLPWGIINLVSHGNEFVDLRVRMFPKGPRTSSRSLMQAVNENKFNSLDSALVDSMSIIYLHGCGIGNNKELLKAFSTAFGGKENPLQVKASKLFEYYGYASNNRNPQSIRRYFAKTWYAFYKPDSIPDKSTLEEQFESRYPNDKIHWTEAINRRVQTNPAQLYHTIINVPLIWDDLYETKEKRPVLNSPESQMEWLEKQKGLHQLIQQTKVPPNCFNIKYVNVDLKAADGKVYYSIRAKLMGEVMCIVQPLLAMEENARKQFEPFEPEPYDTRFFGLINPPTIRE